MRPLNVLIKTLALIASLVLFSSSLKAEQIYSFSSPEEEKLFRQITSELRCPKCQNQSIADSDAELSEDLRLIVYQKLKKGKTKKQILSYMQERYGDFVLYDPPMNKKTYILWFLPLFVFLIIIIALISKVGKRRYNPDAEDVE